MGVNLIGLTQPSAITGCRTAEELVAYCARVSNPANQANHQSGSKLITHLLTEGHWSPLEMVSVNMEIITTRDIARQILRHRSFSFQEFSQRYAVAQNFEFREARMQDHKNRQNSIKTDDSYIKETFNMKQVELLRRIEEVYGWALEVGIAKEQARAILPEGMTQSTMYMNGTLRSWIHYCMLRRANGTQLEHMLIADECWEVLKQHFPSVTEAVDNLG